MNTQLKELKQKIANKLDFRKFAEELIGEVRGQHHNHGDTELEFTCPFHENDTDPSFNFNIDKGAYNCFGCDAEGSYIDLYMELEGLEFWPALVELAERTSVELPDPSLTLQEYAEAKGLDPDLLRDLGLEDGDWYGDDALRVPYWDRNGDLFRTRCRRSLYKLNGKDSKDKRFVWYSDGEGQTLYGLWKLPEYEDRVLLVEGASDCHTLWNTWENYPVLGVPGKSNYKKLWDKWGKHLEGFGEITLLQENDAQDAVTNAAADLKKNTDADIYILDLPTDDVSDLYIEDQNGFEERWAEVVGRKQKFDPSQTEENTSEWQPNIKLLSTVEPEEISWLWKPYIPQKKITLLEGDPGVGKTFLALQLAAKVSTGENFLKPGVKERDPRMVLYMTAEDGLADTIRPRLDQLDGDSNLVATLKNEVNKETGEKNFITLKDLDILARTFNKVNPGLVVIDPLQGFLGAEVDMHRANEVRPILSDIADLAEEFNTSILLIRHLTKSSRSKSIYRGIGSIDFTAHARSILMAGKDPDNEDQKVMAHVKSNLTEAGPAIGYRLDDSGFKWTGESNLSSIDIVEPERGRGEKNKQEEAEEYLKSLLKGEPKPSSEVLRKGQDELGVSEKTIRNAKDAIGVDSKRLSDHWVWFLPEDEEEEVPF